mmetsp:Transcript_10551/g.33393  ORF Transcript_10551/g.33393 Transcript_10551/m.33393 type:complete len:344 (-) Transcript_10551:534-1565(-)
MGAPERRSRRGHQASSPNRRRMSAEVLVRVWPSRRADALAREILDRAIPDCGQSAAPVFFSHLLVQLLLVAEPVHTLGNALEEHIGHDFRLCRTRGALNVDLLYLLPVPHKLLDAVVVALGVKLGLDILPVELLCAGVALVLRGLRILRLHMVVELLDAPHQLGSVLLERGVIFGKAMRVKDLQGPALGISVQLPQPVLVHGQVGHCLIVHLSTIELHCVLEAHAELRLHGVRPRRLYLGHTAIVHGPAILRGQVHQHWPVHSAALHLLRPQRVVHLPGEVLDILAELRAQFLVGKLLNVPQVLLVCAGPHDGHAVPLGEDLPDGGPELVLLILPGNRSQGVF